MNIELVLYQSLMTYSTLCIVCLWGAPLLYHSSKAWECWCVSSLELGPGDLWAKGTLGDRK